MSAISGGKLVYVHGSMGVVATPGVSNYARRTTQARSESLLDETAFVLLFGVVLPTVALVFELLTSACADRILDPIPTSVHAGLVASVPLANLLVLLATHHQVSRGIRFLGAINGLALGVSLPYSLLFLPMLPFSFLGVFVFGAGFLPLSPMFAFLAAFRCRERLTRATIPGGRDRHVPGVWFGFCLAILVLGGSILPANLTEYGMQQAMSVDPTERQAGVEILRTWGSNDQMLRACYKPAPHRMDVVRWLHGGHTDLAEARNVFYQVTGEQFDAYPVPSGNRRGLLDQSSPWVVASDAVATASR